jgi:hypothetical protein
MAEWGNITWVTLHSISTKIKISEFENNKNDVLNFVYLVITHLPCSICSKHGIKYLNDNNFSNIKVKNELIVFLFNFHNSINTRLNKPLKTWDFIDRYYLINIENIFEIFLTKYTKKNDFIINFLARRELFDI